MVLTIFPGGSNRSGATHRLVVLHITADHNYTGYWWCWPRRKSDNWSSSATQNTGWWCWPMKSDYWSSSAKYWILVMVTNKKVIGDIFGPHHQLHHSWYPTYCNIKGYLYTRGKLNLNICTKGCYFQFQCSVSIFKILTILTMFCSQEVFSCPSEVS